MYQVQVPPRLVAVVVVPCSRWQPIIITWARKSGRHGRTLTKFSGVETLLDTVSNVALYTVTLFLDVFGHSWCALPTVRIWNLARNYKRSIQAFSRDGGLPSYNCAHKGNYALPR